MFSLWPLSQPGENLASPGIIQKHLSLTFGRVSGLNFFTSKQNVPVSLPKRSYGRAAVGDWSRRTPPKPPSAHAGRPGKPGKHRGGARGGSETTLRCHSLIPGRWSHPAKERCELEVPFRTEGSLQCIQTYTQQPQKVSRLTLQSPEGLPVGAVALGSPAAAGVTAISRGVRAGRARLVFGAPVGPSRRRGRVRGQRAP